MNLPENLVILDRPSYDSICKQLTDKSITALSVTNGIYNAPAEKMTGTTLSGFQYLKDRETTHLQSAFMVAVNSDTSARSFISDDKIIEPQINRALKVATPLALQYPNRTIVIPFFEEDTPVELFTALQKASISLSAIFKWGGYGTGTKTPIIPGANLFEKAFAFPFYNADKPAGWDNTEKGNQTDIVTVVNLHETVGPHGNAYLAQDNTPLFPTPNL